MKYFFNILILCLISFTISKDSYLCRKSESEDKDFKLLTQEDCLTKIDKGKCCYVEIDQNDQDIHKMCAKVEGDVNDETIKKLKEELGEETKIIIDCNSSFLKTALINIIIMIGILI